MQQKQFVESSTGGDADVIERRGDGSGLRQPGDGARRPPSGRPSFFPQHAEGRTVPEVLPGVPRAALLEPPVPPRHRARSGATRTTGELLSQQAGHRGQLVTRPQGERRVWLDMAQKNAAARAGAAPGAGGNQEARLAALQEPWSCRDACSASNASTSATPWARRPWRPAWCSKSRRCRAANTGATTSPASARRRLRGDAPGAEAALRARCPTAKGIVPDLMLIDGGQGQVASRARCWRNWA